MRTAALAGPARIDVFLTLLGRLRIPPLRRAAVLDGRVLVSAVPLTRSRNEGGVDDLPAHRQKTVLAQIRVEGGKQGVDRAGIGQRLAIQPQRGGVGHRIFQAQTQKAHERQPVAQLILHLLVRQVVERLHNQRLEDEHLVPGTALATPLAVVTFCAVSAASSFGRNSSHGMAAANVNSGSFLLSNPS